MWTVKKKEEEKFDVTFSSGPVNMFEMIFLFQARHTGGSQGVDAYSREVSSFCLNRELMPTVGR